MTDLDICKRIAEIEGLPCALRSGAYGGKWCIAQTKGHSSMRRYSPITDDALWVSLIEKYEVSISFVFCKVLINIDRVIERNFSSKSELRRNALLLIIEAHNDKD